MGLRCDVCGRWMGYLWRMGRASWRCPSEGFLQHYEKERAV